MVLGNALKVNVTIIKSNMAKAWIVDLNETARYETTLFLGRSESLNLHQMELIKDVQILMIHIFLLHG